MNKKINYPDIKEIKFIKTELNSFEVILESEGKLYYLEFVRPTKYELIDGLLEAYWIHIIDLNESHNSHLEFGRYEIKLQSEDTGSVIFNCDNYQLIEMENEIV